MDNDATTRETSTGLAGMGKSDIEALRADIEQAIIGGLTRRQVAWRLGLTMNELINIVDGHWRSS